MSLQYPDHHYIIGGLKNIDQIDLDDYAEQLAFIELDADFEDMTSPMGNRFKANVVKPNVWDAAIKRASGLVPNEGPGILIFVSYKIEVPFSAGLLTGVKELADHSRKRVIPLVLKL